MFQLFMFFMITDPKTITKKRWSQVLVAVLVAVMETFLRLVFKDVHSLYHCLFIVGPAANLVQIYADKKRSKALVPSVPSVPPAPATIAAGDALADGVTAQRPDATEPRTVAAP